MKRNVFVVTTVIVLGTLNWLVLEKERLLSNGRPVLLELAPRDPRSIMQGDYMVLRYRVAQEVSTSLSEPRDGNIILRLDADNVATYVRIDDGSPLGPGEYRLRFRRRDGSILLGAESYLFEEGKANHFDMARYGELRVAPSGASVLVGLRDEQLQAL